MYIYMYIYIYVYICIYIYLYGCIFFKYVIRLQIGYLVLNYRHKSSGDAWWNHKSKLNIFT